MIASLPNSLHSLLLGTIVEKPDLLHSERITIFLPFHWCHWWVGVYRAADDAWQFPWNVDDRGHVDHSGRIWTWRKRSVLMTMGRSRFRDLIRLKKKRVFFPFSFVLLSDAAAISASIVFNAESKEKEEIRLRVTVQHYIAGGSSHIAERDKNNQSTKRPIVKQVCKSLCCKRLHIYKAVSLWTLVICNPDMYNCPCRTTT